MSKMKKIRVGYQGEPGAFSAMAAHQLLADVENMNDVELVSFGTFDELFRALECTDISGAVVAMENSLVGSVREGNVENYERLRKHRPAIVRETTVHVIHNLIASPGVTLAEIRHVYSHPMALLQCQRFLQGRGRQFEAVAYADTAGSVRKILDERIADGAAIASELAAQIYGGAVLVRNIGDDDENYTRFFLLGSRVSNDSKSWRCVSNKTSIVIGVKNAPGALASCLVLFSDVNLTKIDARPIVGKPWKYLFYVDFLGNPREPHVAKVLERLSSVAEFVEILGCYEAATVFAQAAGGR